MHDAARQQPPRTTFAMMTSLKRIKFHLYIAFCFWSTRSDVQSSDEEVGVSQQKTEPNSA